MSSLHSGYERGICYGTDRQAVIFLGIPLWWKTTNIYRAKLPLELMDEWSDGKVSFPRGKKRGFDDRLVRLSFLFLLLSSLWILRLIWTD